MHTDMRERAGWGEPGLGLQRLLRREAGRWWWAPLAAGVAWFVVAWLVLRADATSLATVGVLVGVAFLLAAANEAALAWVANSAWKVAHYVLAAMFVLAAVWAFVRPIDTFFALASVLGLLLLLEGAFSIIRGLALRDVSPYWSLELFSGVLISLLGVWVSVSDRIFDLAARTALILLWVAFMALFRGISDIVLGFSMLWYAKRGEDRGLDRPAVGTAADLSGQAHLSPADGSRQGRSEAPARSGA